MRTLLGTIARHRHRIIHNPMTRSPFLVSALRSAAVCMALSGTWATHAFAGVAFAIHDTTAQPDRFTTVVQFEVIRSSDIASYAQVDFATVDGSAVAGRDYTETKGTLSFEPGQTMKMVTVPIAGRQVSTPLEFGLKLTNPAARPTAGKVWLEAGSSSISNFVQGAAVADLNGDGQPDAVFTAASSGAPALSILRNATPEKSGKSKFAKAITVALPSAPFRVSSADLNRDGRPDLIVSTSDATAFYVLLNDTKVGGNDLAFSRTDVALSSATYDAATADFDGDGIEDIATAGGVSGTVSVWRNTTPKGAETPQLTKVGTLASSPGASSYSFSVRTLDVNHDGKPDLAVGNLLAPEVDILINTTAAGGPITFAPAIAVPVADGVTGLETGDVDGDGLPDLVSANNSSQQTGKTFSVLLNRTATAAPTPAFTVQNMVEGAPYDLRLADMNGDGTIDIVLANLNSDGQGNGAITIYLNRTPAGAPSAQFEKLYTAFVAEEPHALGLADFNHDGRLDIVTAQFSSFPPEAAAAKFLFGQKAPQNPSAKIKDAEGIATLTPKRGS
ncbi:FG-GAP-like repeat-containing protein [Ideonella azotifigens]|uniref:FG-GAP-like repeat-containing protein n=1 Tax=Ideonella azotifigens TaxID=513160 RepID=UPI001477748D|nr:FG-GAP-like repeat-containing protein [Ideonella azotifigens]